jgi:hypothetical protein
VRGADLMFGVGRSHRALRFVAPPLFGLMICGCDGHSRTSWESAARYVVTATPIDIGVGSSRMCLAIDPDDRHGVWWWEPGRDCSTRSTGGPTVFKADNAVVVPSGRPGTTDIRFRLQLIRAANSSQPPFADILLRLEGSQLQAAATGSRVAMYRRRDLDIPER